MSSDELFCRTSHNLDLYDVLWRVRLGIFGKNNIEMIMCSTENDGGGDTSYYWCY